MVTIDRECLISEKQNNKARAEGARLPKEAMLLRDIFKLTKPSLDAFRPFGLISRAYKGPRQGWGNFCKSKAAFQITGNQLGRNLKQQYT